MKHLEEFLQAAKEFLDYQDEHNDLAGFPTLLPPFEVLSCEPEVQV